MAEHMEPGEIYMVERARPGYLLRCQKSGVVVLVPEGTVKVRIHNVPEELCVRYGLSVHRIDAEFISGRRNNDHDRVMMDGGWLPLLELFVGATLELV